MSRMQLVWDDVAELMRINPVASEQLKNIALQRRMAELERRLAEATGEKLGDDQGGEALPAEGEGSESLS